MQDLRQGKYLVLPSVIGKSKDQVFAEIKEKVGEKLFEWKEKIPSIGGKEVLIKAVIQAIPTYTMSCFQLLKGLCEDLERMERIFGGGRETKRLKWLRSAGENVQAKSTRRYGFL